jgi:hypothetical protein
MGAQTAVYGGIIEERALANFLIAWCPQSPIKFKRQLS